MVKRAQHTSMQQRSESSGNPLPQLFDSFHAQFRLSALHFHLLDRKEGACQNIQPKPTRSTRINVLNATKKITRCPRKNIDQIGEKDVAWTLLFCCGSCDEIDDP